MFVSPDDQLKEKRSLLNVCLATMSHVSVHVVSMGNSEQKCSRHHHAVVYVLSLQFKLASGGNLTESSRSAHFEQQRAKASA